MFSLNSVKKIFIITAKGLKPATSWMLPQYQKDMSETEYLNLAQFMLQLFIRFSKFAEFIEFMTHLGKTPMVSVPNLPIKQPVSIGTKLKY